MITSRFFLVTVGLALASGDRVGHHQRRGRQEGGAVQGGIDFSGCVEDASTGLCCVEKEEEVTSIEKEPILECTHKNVEQCHYSYVTQFTPTQEEVCEENFEKTCSITFKQQAFNETVKKCYKPTEKVCDGTGPEECRTVYESSCSTKYVEKQPGKFVGDTKCEKLPVEICGAGCVFQEGAEECHDKVIASLVDVPEEVCDLNPQKNLSVHHSPGAETETRAPVHNYPERDLHTEVHTAKTSSQAAVDQMVFRSDTGSTRRLI